jgi:NitT/TauT family transport system permease protein
MNSFIYRYSPPFVFALIIIVLWYAFVFAFDIERIILPQPHQIIAVIYERFSELLHATMITASAALLGLLASLILGFTVSVIFSLSSYTERGLYPLALFFQTVPIVAIAPLIILWVGHGFLSVMLIAMILSLFPIIANTTTGLTRLPKSYLELFELYESNVTKRMLLLQIPHSLPHIIAGLRVSSGLAVIGSIIGEFSSGYEMGGSGLGYYIAAASQYKTDLLFASIFASTMMGWLIFLTIDKCGNLLLSKLHMNKAKVK